MTDATATALAGGPSRRLHLAAKHLSRPILGETCCGDSALVRQGDDLWLFALIDALGHGPKAAEAAAVAVAFLERVPLTTEVVELLRGLHRALRGTRGAAATLGVFDGATLWSCGVGNVTLRAVGSHVPAFCWPGILGQRLPRRMEAFANRLAAGDRLVLFSDGVARDLDPANARGLSTGAACAALLAEHARRTDDATVLVVDVIPDGGG